MRRVSTSRRPNHVLSSCKYVWPGTASGASTAARLLLLGAAALLVPSAAHGQTDPDQSTCVAMNGTAVADGVDFDVIVVTLLEADGITPVPGHVVSLAVIVGNAATVTIIPPSGTSNASGQVAFQVFSTEAQTVTFQATDDTDGVVITQTADVIFTPGPPVALLFVQQPTDTSADDVITPAVTVEIVDAFDNRVTTATDAVTLAIDNNPGGGTLSGGGPQTAVGGVATFDDLSIDRVGVGYTLRATAAGLMDDVSDPFNITPGVPTHLAFVQQPTNTSADDVITPAVTVELLDGCDNRVTTDNATQITLAIDNNPGGGVLTGTNPQTVVNGLATFADLNIDKTGTGYTLRATSGVLADDVSDPFNITPGAPTHLAFAQQPTDTVACSCITPPVTVEILDACDNRVTTDNTTQITMSLACNPCGGTLSGGGPQTAVSGLVVFDCLSIDVACLDYCLQAEAAGFPPLLSDLFNITPGAPAQLAFVQQPTDTAAGNVITPPVTVEILDACDNRVTTATDPITLSIENNPGGGTLSGTTTQNAVKGLATFDDLSIDETGAGYTLRAESGGLAADISDPFDITPSAGVRLAFVQQPTDTSAEHVIRPPVTVEVLDAFDNRVTDATDAVTLYIDNNPGAGALGGTTTQNPVNGLATFYDLHIDQAGNCYTLRAKARGLTDDVSAAFNIAPGATTQLVYFFPMEADPGWCTEGQWEFGQPLGGGSYNGDPTSGHTGTNVCGYNLAGDYSNNMSATLYLTTAALDCKDLTNTELRFRRWLGVESAVWDHGNIEVSNDGVKWSMVWEHVGSSLSEASWSLQTYDLSQVADDQATVYIRWGMGPTDDSVTYPGWNIDDVEIWAVAPEPVPGDLDADGDVDQADLGILLADWGCTGGNCPGDCDGDGDTDPADLGILLVNWGYGT